MKAGLGEEEKARLGLEERLDWARREGGLGEEEKARLELEERLD